MTRILVADDHPIVRLGFRQIAADTPDMVIAAEAGDGPELLEQARGIAHDLVLLDLSMPNTDSMALLKMLKRERAEIPVLALSIWQEHQLAIRALKAGAAGYLTKSSSPSELVAAIRRVATGGRYLSAEVADKIAAHLAGVGHLQLHDRLSDRELQVLRMIAAGKSTKLISAELSLSAKTVSTYRSRIFEKMQMKSPVELAIYAVRSGLAD
jgi:DNA-binding NarL/FixJ family response regulator